MFLSRCRSDLVPPPGSGEPPTTSEVQAIDVVDSTALLEHEKVHGDVLNIIPPQRAGDIAANA